MATGGHPQMAYGEPDFDVSMVWIFAVLEYTLELWLFLERVMVMFSLLSQNMGWKMVTIIISDTLEDIFNHPRMYESLKLVG